MKIAYPFEVSEARRAVRIAFPDLPDTWTECAPSGEQEAAAALLVEALEFCVRERFAIPRPTRRPDCEVIEPPLLVAAKVALYQAMRQKKLSNVAFARQLGTVEGTVRRLIDLRHRSHVDQVEAALAILGRRLAVTVRRI
ncbi:MAG: hypothetical protein OXQ90_02265 [Gammaproteobacteria bacterium]|nr:hypothetical protein [Gammaproteobacteria bacterium]